MTKNLSYKNVSYSRLANRRSFSKIDTNFSEPDLLEMQKASYKNFLENKLEGLIGNYFPVKHAKNNKYEIHFKGISFTEPLHDEEKCRNEEKTYERALYADLSLINNETGEVKRVKKTASNLSKGVFFANIPIMTEKGTFIINGIEKFVISQIVRAPGIYILNKSQIKLNNKKKINHGYICEMLPNKGTLINFWIDEQNQTIKVIMRNSVGDNAPSFPATQILKAFGMTQDEIRRVFKDNVFILNTLYTETYNHTNILQDFEIVGYRNDVNKLRETKDNAKGSPIDAKLKRAIVDYEDLKIKREELYAKYQREYDKIYNQNEILRKELKEASEKDKPSVKNKIASLQKESYRLLEQLQKIDKKMRDILDVIITEKAAKDLIGQLGISTRAIESYSSSKKNPICYQEVITSHFMENRKYDLTGAGRHRTQHKLHISDRLYQRVLAEDILYKNGNVFMPKGTLVLKDELDRFKDAAQHDELKIFEEVNLNTTTKTLSQNANFIESVLVYTDNDEQDLTTPIIGESSTLATQSLSLTLVDFICCMSYTINLPHGIGQYDDIDHLGNKRLRLIDEQLKQKLQIGMARVEKHIKDKLASISIATANDEQQAKVASRTTVKTMVNTKPFQLMVKNFFNTNQLTQFVDQQNPLSELSNKRRISAMGDGGISREDPNLDIRDIHYSHYGRICPIETPEGMNIGLIMSLASFTRIDPNGFLISPYHKVIKGVVQKEVVWLPPLKENEYIICESSVPQDKNGKILAEKTVCRYRGNQQEFDVNKIDFIDIAPRQAVSIAASVIPFLEHDDTTRALMGANMQRQAVPLIHPYAPIVGTGSEYKIAHDSGLTLVAKNPGTIEKVDANQIIVRNEDNKLDRYNLIKYRKSNQDTCINQTPIVDLGQKVSVGETLTDGPAMYNGELALGRNPLVAFTTWNGYNYEDAIVISDRLVKDDVYTSIAIEEHTIKCLRTKNGDEEITRDLLNVSEEAKRHLDEDGIIMVGAEVKEGDILVGKMTPRGQSDFSPEEKLLQAIFSSKAKNFRESSLKVPNGGGGIVAKVQRFSISNNDELEDDVIELVKIFIAQKRKIQIGDKMSGRHGNKGCISIVAPAADMPFLADGTPVDICLNPLGVPSRMNIGQVLEINLGLSMRQLGQQKAIEFVFKAKNEKECVENFVANFGLKPEKAKVLIKVIKNYCNQNKITSLAEAKEKIGYNDVFLMLKQAGLDIEALNFKAATPVFSGATMDEVLENLKEANNETSNLSRLGKMQLFDGKTGEPFDGLTTVGVMYMMKLDHMVDDKIHARAVGPYSKITQQPLGGKSQNGGQRFGEMEVWALEAYGTAHNLQEILTIKSDDVKGRNQTYNAIVRGAPLPTPGLPETFKLLTKQLQGLGLTVDAVYKDGTSVDINTYSSVSEDENVQPVEEDNTVFTNVETIDFEDNF
ncbi:MAG: DNA-directed RNA polymerase subunit beta [Mycoplasma sp.]